MTNHRFETRYGVTRVFFTPEESTELNSNPFHVELTLQPSGAVLVDYRTPDGILSSYLDTVKKTHLLTNKMYGGNQVFSLTPDEVNYLEMVAKVLRANSKEWDAKFAPGPGFRGHDMTPVNGLSDFSRNRDVQGYTKHRYED